MREGDAVFVSPDHRIDPGLCRYGQSAAFRKFTTETRRNYANDLVLLLTFLASRGRHWTQARDQAQVVQALQPVPVEAMQPSTHRLLTASRLDSDRRDQHPVPAPLHHLGPQHQIPRRLPRPRQPMHRHFLSLVAALPRLQHHPEPPHP
ncbi:hypothetical protein FHR34_007571 [Kitasatospora kifunensis]|uniref:Uncharacterized protein n=1 Tax=Kitasatospora kifunensis TaxID=58351 RepID=A0A7W7RAR6_KITKI|nr:hypothetical protein [Kitasatospora kifunensis]